MIQNKEAACTHPPTPGGGGGCGWGGYVGILVRLTRRSCYNTTSLVAMATTTGSAYSGVLVTGSDVTRSRTYVH